MKSKEGKRKSSLLAKYSQLYERNPRSRAFAPLAEVYRSLGMIDESLKLLRDGLRRHPQYLLGHIVLAHCYYDQEYFELAYKTLQSFVGKNVENITLQKLFGKICIKLGYFEEALQSYKYLLFVNPKDGESALEIKKLEDELALSGSQDLPQRMRAKDLEEIQNYDPTEEIDEGWVAVNFAQAKEEDIEIQEEAFSEIERAADEFKKQRVEERSLEDQYYFEDYDNDSEDVIGSEERESNDDEISEDGPIITHTLVDLYAKQGYIQKAIEILDGILELHSDDQATLEKRKNLALQLEGNSDDQKGEEQEDNLLNLVDSIKKESLEEKIEQELHLFIDALYNEAVLFKEK